MLGLQCARHQACHGLPYYTDFAWRLRDAFDGFKEVMEKLLTIDARLLAERACKSGQCKPDLHIEAVQWWSRVVGHWRSLFKSSAAHLRGHVDTVSSWVLRCVSHARVEAPLVKEPEFLGAKVRNELFFAAARWLIFPVSGD